MRTTTVDYNNQAPTFLINGDGQVTTNMSGAAGGWNSGNSVAIQGDGKILVAGTSSGNFALVRYNVDGTLDSGFGQAGKTLTTAGVGSSWDAGAYSITVQPDGNILVAGTSWNGTNYDFAVLRYDTQGNLDASFGVNGQVNTDFGGTDWGNTVAVQADGKILVAGTSWNATLGRDESSLVRYNSDGSLDTTFDGDGKASTDIACVTKMVMQNDGKILVAGTDGPVNVGHFVLVRYNTDGSLDTSLNGDGKVITSSLGNASSVTVQADGKILVAGTGYSGGGGRDFTLMRFILMAVSTPASAVMAWSARLVDMLMATA